MTTTREFEYSKRTVTTFTTSTSASMTDSTARVASNISILSTPRRREILINGVLQGRKQFDPKGASCASRRALWKATLDVAIVAGIPALVDALEKSTYSEVKGTKDLESRAQVKSDVIEVALKGWKRNVGDEGWGLEDG